MARGVIDPENPTSEPAFARRVLDSFPELISYVDADERYRFVNRGYQEWFGVKASEIEGHSMREILGDEAYAKVQPHARRAFQGERVTYTTTMPYRLGAPHEIEALLIPDLAQDGAVRGVFALVRDVGERERLQREMLSVLDGMDACFIALDPEDRITFVNAAAETFQMASGRPAFGDRASVLGRRLWDINPEGYGGILHQAVLRVRANGQQEAFEYSPQLRPDRIVDTRVFPTPSGSVGISYIDVTERRHTADELRRNEERLRIALEAARMTAFDYDAVSGESRFSENVEQVLGHRTSFIKHVHPDDQPAAMAAGDHALETGARCDVTVRYPSPVEGEWLWMNLQATRAADAEGRPVRLVGVIRDVTQAKIAQDLLSSANIDLEARVRSETTERLQAVQDRERFWTLSRDLFAVMSSPDGLVRRINAEAWRATLGYSPDQLIGTQLRVFGHPDDFQATLDGVAKLGAVPMVEFENRFRHADGGWRWLSWKVIAEGELHYAAARDVTEEKAREEQVRRSQKLEALGHLTGGGAHDFNNLLTVIMGALDLMQKRPHDEALRGRLVSAALAASKRGERLNKQLLGFARKQASHQEFVVPSRRLEEMAPLIKGALSDLVAIELDTAEARGAMADPAQFEVAVLNLVVNARDAMPDGGTLSISARAAHDRDARRLALPPANYLVLEVTDTGTGMSQEVLSHVFEPFFTTKDVGKGSGLGLAQVYSFARQSGGTVGIRTELGRGSTVAVYLPASDPPPAADEPASGRTGTGPGRRILLVEDDALVGAVTESMLADMGHQVTRAEDGMGALDALARAEFDLLFTDVRMPGGLNGVQLAREAVRGHPDLKVLLCSGWTDNMLGEESRGARWPLLAKPFDVVELEQALRDVLAV